MKAADKAGFGKRLRQAFKGAGNSEIARRLHTEPSTLTNYMKGRIPPAETLAAIANLTNCSIDWLVTGQGEADLDPLQFIEDRTLQVVQKLASDSGKKVEAVINSLLIEALRRRGADMLASEVQLPPKQMDQLRMILSLVLDGEGNGETDNTTTSAASSQPRRA